MKKSESNADLGKFSLREMLVGDVEAVAELEASLGWTNWSATLFEGEFKLSTNQRFWLVAFNEQKIIGFAGVSASASESHILNLGVEIGWQRKGVATVLIQQLLEWAKSMDSSVVLLEVEQQNQAALSLYKAFGFEELSERQNYYGQGRHSQTMKLLI